MYKTVWAWAVAQHVEKGDTVMCLDRETCTITEVNEMPWKAAVALLNDALALEKAATGTATRYEFWIKDDFYIEEGEGA